MSKPTLDQRRAKHAWEAITALKGKDGKYPESADEYAREAKKLPVRIMTSGLGQALAFVLAKAGTRKALSKLHDDLTRWVIAERPMKAKNPSSLRDSVIYGDSSFLRLATDETLAYLHWLNRFAAAEGLPSKDSGGD